MTTTTKRRPQRETADEWEIGLDEILPVVAAIVGTVAALFLFFKGYQETRKEVIVSSNGKLSPPPDIPTREDSHEFD